MNFEVFTQQVLAIEPKAKERLSEMTDEMFQAYKKELLEAESSFLERIMDNLPRIHAFPVRDLAEWLDKFRLLRSFVIWVEQEEGGRKEKAAQDEYWKMRKIEEEGEKGK